MSRIVAICGPTASGKSALALALSRKLNAPILSADSRQVYRELDIGVGRPKAQECEAAPHKLLAYRSIFEPYSAGQWSRDARACLEMHFAMQPDSICIIAGGSGLHIKGLVDGLPEMPQVPEEIREHYEQVFRESGLNALQDELLQKDPEYAAVVDLQNAHRLQRALAAIEASGGQTFTSLRAQKAKGLPYPVDWIVLEPEMDWLEQRIALRIDEMLADGLEAEARKLYPFRQLDGLRSIGYQEWWPYFEGTIDRQSCIDQIRLSTRQYAKRQRTWNKRLQGLRLQLPEVQPALDYILADR